MARGADLSLHPAGTGGRLTGDPVGQLSFVGGELSTLAQVPRGLGMGLFYWSPAWIPGVGWEPGAGVGSPNVNLTLFDFQGAALPSIGIFENPAQVCALQPVEHPVHHRRATAREPRP